VLHHGPLRSRHEGLDRRSLSSERRPISRAATSIGYESPSKRSPTALTSESQTFQHVLVDVILFSVFVVVIFAALSLLFAPDSRDTRRAMDRHGSWAGLTA
jgi:hypothetical protein